MAAANEAELRHMVATQVAIGDRPSAVRYPRGEGTGVELPAEGLVLPIGKGRILREGTSIAIISLGARLAEALKAADELATFGLPATVADARFMKPLDRDLILDLAREHEVLITVEEGSIGGFGSHVLHTLAEAQLLDGGLKVRSMVLPDVFIDHGHPHQMYELAGLNASSIVRTAMVALGDAQGPRFRLVTGLPQSAHGF
jgi:1-deoxy-D-xylulose-5-phosphate synthase